MNEITVRFRSENKPFDPNFLNHLDQMAEKFGVRIDEKSRLLMEEIREQGERVRLETLFHEMDALAQQIGPQQTDSVDLIREDRDR